MRKIVQRLLDILGLLGLTVLSALIVTIVVTLKHMLDTPQPLESILPGEAAIYRWRHGHLFYKTLGDENAPPLVLLHAPKIGASSYEMRKIAGALAQHYHVYALDLLGFGLSDRPEMDYSADMYIEMCHDFLTDVVARPATIVASELSCNYAVMLAERLPELCTRLVLISPVWLFSSAPARSRWSELLREPIVERVLYALLSTRSALRYALSRQRSPQEGQVTASNVDYLYAATHQFGAEHAPIARLAGKLAVDASTQFEALPQPALVIWGARALHDTQRALSSQQQLPQQAEMALIQDAGLYVHEEYPATVVANIVQWSGEGDGYKKTWRFAKRAATAKAKTKGEAEQEQLAATQAEVQEPVAEPSSTKVEVEKPLEKQLAAAEVESQGQEARGETDEEHEYLMAYCARCKKKTMMKDAEEVTTKNGNPAVRGKCSVCGAGQYRMGRIAKEA